MSVWRVLEERIGFVGFLLMVWGVAVPYMPIAYAGCALSLLSSFINSETAKNGREQADGEGSIVLSLIFLGAGYGIYTLTGQERHIVLPFLALLSFHFYMIYAERSDFVMRWRRPLR